jgi:putative tricarboxylic transport membrane protein
MFLRVSAWCVLAAFSAAAVAQSAWKPERAVEIIVGTSPGGGQDQSARTIQKVIQEKRLVDVGTAVVNKPGGSSAVGYMYLHQHAANGHYLMLATTPLITNHISGLMPITYTDLTPIAILYDENIVTTVAANSPIKSGKELIERLRRDPTSLSIGIPSAGGGPHLAFALAAKGAGVDVKKLKVVVFKSSGDSFIALLGGHIDVVASTTASAVPQFLAGKARILAIASPKRMGGAFAPVPTWREQGTNAVFANWRGIVGPRGLTPAQIGYWESVLGNVASSEEFKKDIEDNLWMSNFLKGDEMRQRLKQEYDDLKVVLGDLGMAK